MSGGTNRRRQLVNADELAQAIVQGSRRALARAITYSESTRAEHRLLVEQLLSVLPVEQANNTLRIGVSGAPGVGKSTFIEALGMLAIAAGRRLAVLAVDPSSSLSGGSILGDKTRMPELSRHADAFIRPSPAGAMLGGVTRRTRESIVFCEAAGFDLIVVETVGVGQSEVAVAQMTDLFVLLLAPGGGDELQGIKRGIMELTDIALITKADGDLSAAAQRAAGDYSKALRMLRPRSRNWTPIARQCSALTGKGMQEALDLIVEYEKVLGHSAELDARRKMQASDWLRSEINEQLMQCFHQDEAVQSAWRELDKRVQGGELPAAGAAQKIVAEFINRKRGA